MVLRFTRVMSNKPILDRLKVLAESNLDMQQFGQKRSEHVHDGRTACTHTVLQYLYLAFKGTKLSLNDVNKLAGMPRNAKSDEGFERGMRPNEFKTFIRNAKLPMKVVFGRSFSDLLKASEDGPVFYAMRYGAAPRRAPNGATQALSNDRVRNMRHAVVMLGFEDTPKGRMGYRKDPNHRSP